MTLDEARAVLAAHQLFLENFGLAKHETVAAMRLLLAEGAPPVLGNADSVELNAAINALQDVDRDQKLDHSGYTLPDAIRELGATISNLTETLDTHVADTVRLDYLARRIAESNGYRFCITDGMSLLWIGYFGTGDVRDVLDRSLAEHPAAASREEEAGNDK